MAADTERGADEETVLVGKLDGAHISIRLDGLRVALAAQGLHVVTDTEASELAALRERVARALKALESDSGTGISVPYARDYLRGR